MHIPLFARFKSLFARDKESFWWHHFTDYELSLSRMSLSELASELDRTQVRRETANSIIVEHLLAARLAKIQSRASWWSGWLGFAGAMLAAALTFYLGQLSSTTSNAPKAEYAAACTPTPKKTESAASPSTPASKQEAGEAKISKPNVPAKSTASPSK